jgi:hypothetical protein
MVFGVFLGHVLHLLSATLSMDTHVLILFKREGIFDQGSKAVKGFGQHDNLVCS